MHALDGRQCIHVLARGDRHLVELVVAVAVEQAEQPILAADANHLVLLAVDGRLEARAHLTEIGVMHVVGDELKKIMISPWAAVCSEPALRPERPASAVACPYPGITDTINSSVVFSSRCPQRPSALKTE